MRPHVEAYNRQLQGAFTRKTQEMAEWRKSLAPAEDLYQRLYSDDESTRDAAVRDALRAGGWDDLTAEQQQAVVEEYQDHVAPQADPYLLSRVEAAEQRLAARDQADAEREEEVYFAEFAQRYESAVDGWAKRNGYSEENPLPDYLRNQIAGYARGVAPVEEDGRAFADMDTALQLLDADRAGYLTSKDPGFAPNVAAVSAEPARHVPKTEAERLALANAIAARHV
jgi:hypothetical protein